MVLVGIVGGLRNLENGSRFRGSGTLLEEAPRIAPRIESQGGHYTVMLRPRQEVPPEFETFAEPEDDDETSAAFAELADEDAADDKPLQEPRRSAGPPRLPCGGSGWFSFRRVAMVKFRHHHGSDGDRSAGRRAGQRIV